MRLKYHYESFKDVKLMKNPVALITGDGRTLPSDLERFLSWEIPHDVMAIGRSINLCPGEVAHWANVDGADSLWWAENLPKKRNGSVPWRHTLGVEKGYDIAWDIEDAILWDPKEVLWHGSTALFAVYACLEIGYEKVVLAGCPLDSKGHWYFGPNDQGPRWTGESYQAWLEFMKSEGAEKVRSMSGYTGQIVGEPSEKWIKEAI